MMRKNCRVYGLMVITLLMILLAGCGTSPEPTAMPTATFLPTEVPTVTPTLEPTRFRTPLPTITPTVPATESPVTAAPDEAEPSADSIPEGIAPPFDIALPDDWQVGYGILPFNDGMLQANVPIAIYSGPIAAVPDTTGWIVVFWGYPSISATGAPDPWADGLRFLRSALVDTTCNVGTDDPETFSIGPRDDAAGTYFQAVACEGEPDVSGWFAGVAEQGGHYVFFAYAEPLDTFYPAIPQLQGILDSVSWHIIPTRTPSP